MLHHYNIEHIARTKKPGFGFESYRFATEHQLSGSITFQKDNHWTIQIEGSTENTSAFISWYFENMGKENNIDKITITSSPILHDKEFIINNLSEET